MTRVIGYPCVNSALAAVMSGQLSWCRGGAAPPHHTFAVWWVVHAVCACQNLQGTNKILLHNSLDKQDVREFKVQARAQPSLRKPTSSMILPKWHVWVFKWVSFLALILSKMSVIGVSGRNIQAHACFDCHVKLTDKVLHLMLECQVSC